MSNNNEIRVKVNGGYLVAGKNQSMEDNNYNGIYIIFETNDGDIIDVVSTEYNTENGKSNIDVYNFEDVYTENYTKKHTLSIAEIYEALNG